MTGICYLLLCLMCPSFALCCNELPWLSDWGWIGIREPWLENRGRKETEVRAFRSLASCLLCPSVKVIVFLKVAFYTQLCISVTVCYPCSFRCRDSNSSSITSPGLCEIHCGYPTSPTLIESPFLEKLSSNYPNLNMPSVSCWAADCSTDHQ